MLRAIKLPQLIASSYDDYEDRAVQLATDPERLNSIKEQLSLHRLTEPLFDTRKFAASLEQAYLRMHELRRNDMPPEDIVLVP